MTGLLIPSALLLPAIAAVLGAPFAADQRAAADNRLPDAEDVALTVYATAPADQIDVRSLLRQYRTQSGTQSGGQSDDQWAERVPGFAVVHETRRVRFDDGRHHWRQPGVSRLLDPTTVQMRDANDREGLDIVARRFEYDPPTPGRLLDRAIGQDVVARFDSDHNGREVRGTLLHVTSDEYVIETDDGAEIIDRRAARLTLSEFTGRATTGPSLLWTIDSRRAGERTVRTTYETAGMTWRADYALLIEEGDRRADLTGAATVLNLTGAAFRDAELSLLAGDVHRVEQPRHRPMMQAARQEQAFDAAFEQEPLFTYHLYTLPRRVDLPAGSAQQFPLFEPARDIRVQREYIFENRQTARWRPPARPVVRRDAGQSDDETVDVQYRFENREADGLGMPLPQGVVRVSQVQDDGREAYLGSDTIDHTPRDGEVLVSVGAAFDVAGRRRQTDFRADEGRRTMTETIEIELTNQQDDRVEVIVREHLFRWTGWEITSASTDYDRVDARTIEFTVRVDPGETETLEYTAHYTW